MESVKTPEQAGDRGAALFAWTAWAALLAGALAYVHAYGANVPFNDEWRMVDALTGHQPLTLRWLWEQHNEHRIALPKLVYVGLAKLTGGDFRAGMYFNALVLGVTAAGFMAVARRLRGGVDYPDAFFPLALLHLGHCENLLWGFQIEFVLSTLLACGLLAGVLASAGRLTWRACLTAGACLLGLPVCGAHGLPFVPPLAAWLAAWGWRDRREPGGAARCALALTLATASLTLVALYFVGYAPPGHHPPSPGWRATCRIALQFLTMSCGGGVVPWWFLARFVVSGALLAGGVMLAVAWWRRPAERVRTLGLLAYLVALVGLALGVGWGRAGLADAVGLNLGFADRYATLAAPAACWVFFVGLLRPNASFARLWGMGVYAALLILLLPNTQQGLYYAGYWGPTLRAAARDARAGLPAVAVGQKHPFLYTSRDYLVERLERLRRAGVGDFRFMAAPPALREVLLKGDLHAAAWPPGEEESEPGAGRGAGLTYRLERPREVYGIRVVFRFEDRPPRGAGVGISWKTPGQMEFTGKGRQTVVPLEAQPGAYQAFAYVNERIDQVFIRAEQGPKTFKVLEVKALLPQREQE